MGPGRAGIRLVWAASVYPAPWQLPRPGTPPWGLMDGLAARVGCLRLTGLVSEADRQSQGPGALEAGGTLQLLSVEPGRGSASWWEQAALDSPLLRQCRARSWALQTALPAAAACLPAHTIPTAPRASRRTGIFPLKLTCGGGSCRLLLRLLPRLGDFCDSSEGRQAARSPGSSCGLTPGLGGLSSRVSAAPKGRPRVRVGPWQGGARRNTSFKKK